MTAAGQPRRPDESMSLLQQLMDRPLDPSYATAAARRRERGLPANTSLRTPLVLVSAVLIGFLLVVAASVLRPAGTTASREKQQLIDQIQARQARGDDLAQQVSALRGQIQGVQAAALASQASQLGAELRRLQVLTGEVAARGPGLVLTVDDSPQAKAGTGTGDPRANGGFSTGRVTSFDLQILANGLWQAGAEAMAINGQRLTARSAIRFAGDAVLVDYRPLIPPYVITAIGDGRAMQTGFAAGPSGAYLKSLGDNYAIPSTISTQAALEVPRSASLQVTLAQPSGPVPSGSATPSGTPSSTQTGGPAATPTQTPTPTQTTTTKVR